MRTSVLPFLFASLFGYGCNRDSDTRNGSANCIPCVTSADCSIGVCAQLGDDSYCAAACPLGSECALDQICMKAVDVNGHSNSLCVPRGDVCSALDNDDTRDASGDAAVPPDAAAPSNDGGTQVSGHVGNNGGTVSRLLFAVVGDTRPANIDDIAGYPSAIISKIFSDIAADASHVPFVVTTGDYQFSSPRGFQAAQQLDLYLAARNQYSGVVFPALGNHECTGATASNCGAGNSDGVTNNYAAFLSKLLAPIAQTTPYYVIHITAIDKSWTAKFVFVAANAWSTAQATWLEAALSETTTYTFVVRHESHSANTAPGVTPSEQIIAKHPYTLALVGHTHTYAHYSGREVIIGNGGAPLATTGKNYGYALIGQRSDGAIQVDMIDYMTGKYDARFRFAVKADGSVAP